MLHQVELLLDGGLGETRTRDLLIAGETCSLYTTSPLSRLDLYSIVNVLVADLGVEPSSPAYGAGVLPFDLSAIDSSIFTILDLLFWEVMSLVRAEGFEPSVD